VLEGVERYQPDPRCLQLVFLVGHSPFVRLGSQEKKLTHLALAPQRLSTPTLLVWFPSRQSPFVNLGNLPDRSTTYSRIKAFTRQTVQGKFHTLYQTFPPFPVVVHKSAPVCHVFLLSLLPFRSSAYRALIPVIRRLSTPKLCVCISVPSCCILLIALLV
jgi:hypothetical protein